jgi:ABC-type transport system substrate-binding protein
LFRLDEELKPQPELAAAWPEPEAITFDPFTVTLELRAAKWSDGRAITSADVRFSWEKLRAGPTKWRYRFLTSVEALSPRTVRLRFDRPVQRWWALFSIDDMVLPAHAYSAKWKDGPTISGGPFAFEDWTRGLRIRLKRNDAYGTAVPLRGIDVLFVGSDETRLQLLDRGELDAFFAEGETNLGRRAAAYGFPHREGGLAGEAASSGAWGPTWWELDLDPSKIGTGVARAVIEAASSALVAEILEDSGRTMDGIPSSFTPPVGAPSGPWRGRGSLEEAKEILDGAGVPAGSKRADFQLAYATASNAPSIASFLHFRLREIGITAELVGVENDTFEERFVPQRLAPAMVRLRRGADAPDAGAYSATSGQPGSAAIDDQVVAAETEVADERLRSGPLTGLDVEAWAGAQRALVAGATVSPLALTRSFVVGADGVWGPRTTGAANGPLWNTGTWIKEGR